MELFREIFILMVENSTDELSYGDYESYQEVCLQEENADFNRIFLPIIFSVIFLTGIIGNILVIVVVGYQKKLRSMTDKYRLHLSVADLLFATTLPLWSVDAINGWHFGNHLCKIVHFIYTVNLHSSVLILAFISLDQYLAIVHATNSQRLRELLVKRYVYVGVWLPALLLAIPDIVFANACTISEKYVCQRFYPHDTWLIAFRFEYIWMGFVLPGLMMLTCYCIVISKLSQSKGYQKRKALKTTVILIVVFLACWLPYHIGINIDTFVLLGFIENGCSFETILHKYISITEALAFSHCCLNPILYAFLGVKFRTTTRGTLNSISRASSLRVLSLVK